MHTALEARPKSRCGIRAPIEAAACVALRRRTPRLRLRYAPCQTLQSGLSVVAGLFGRTSSPEYSVPLVGGNSHPATRMVLAVNLAQTPAGNVGVDLRGRQVGMAQHHLYRTQVRTAL